MTNFNFYIRFGVHKDREVIKSLRDSISGMIIPAHILCYSSNATIAAISYIKKDYFIDPMTYIYSDGSMQKYLSTKSGTDSFKPSIAKLTENYGLMDFFVSNNYRPLTPGDLLNNDLLADEFCKKNIALQINKIDEEKAGAYKKYADLLKKVGENHLSEEIEKTHRPKGIIPPYFYFESIDDEWLKVNLKLAEMTRKNTDLPVIPLIFTEAFLLDDGLLDLYKDYKEMFIWADDLEQKQQITNTQQQGLEKFANFVAKATEKGISLTNLYGSYFSVLLNKVGLSGMCNGVFYGENKTRKAKVGGIPPSRYYIRKLHEFYSIPETLAILRKYPDLLDRDCQQCLDLLKGDIENIFTFDSEHALAQSHFVYSREKEIEVAQSKNLDALLNDLDENFIAYRDKLPDEDITRKNVKYLSIWKEILKKYL